MEKDITERLEMILKAYELTPSAFSDQIQIQRSAMSHIFSRRNRPSLDVIQKVLKHFPEINSNWLLSGIGKMKQLHLFDSKETPGNTPKKEEQVSIVTPVNKDNFEGCGNINSEKINSEPIQSEPKIAHLHPKFQGPIFAEVPKPDPKDMNENSVSPIHDHKIVPQEIKIPDVSFQQSEPKTLNQEPDKEIFKALAKPNEKEIEKIIIFYKDKTFTSYSPE